jgi:hypothetical protein
VRAENRIGRVALEVQFSLAARGYLSFVLGCLGKIARKSFARLSLCFCRTRRTLGNIIFSYKIQNPRDRREFCARMFTTEFTESTEDIWEGAQRDRWLTAKGY